MVVGADNFHTPIVWEKTPPIIDISTMITMMGTMEIPSFLFNNTVNFLSDFIVISIIIMQDKCLTKDHSSWEKLLYSRQSRRQRSDHMVIALRLLP